jgi:hypothetical protein
MLVSAKITEGLLAYDFDLNPDRNSPQHGR